MRWTALRAVALSNIPRMNPCGKPWQMLSCVGTPAAKSRWPNRTPSPRSRSAPATNNAEAGKLLRSCSRSGQASGRASAYSPYPAMSPIPT
jgi:hypothetical protein